MMRQLVVDGKIDQLHSRIIAKYRELQNEFKYIVCVGTDYSGVAAPLEFEFNADVANNLNCLIMPVINAADKNPSQVVGTAGVMLESLEIQNCEVLAIVANRTDP